MLVHLPQQSSPAAPLAEPVSNNVRPSFEAALRRDLASRRVIAYEPVIGGVGKRLVDLLVVGVSAPVWLLALLAAIILIKVRRGGDGRALIWEECVGYGARRFMRGRLSWRPPSAEIIPLHPQARQASTQWIEPRIRWADLIERLPELINILKGDMSLVGARPLSHGAFYASRRSFKYYASARPGFVNASQCDLTDDAEAPLLRSYAKQWSLALDRRVIMLALRRFEFSGRAPKQDLPPEAE